VPEFRPRQLLVGEADKFGGAKLFLEKSGVLPVTGG